MTSLPPKCSASVTTPSGIDIHALMRGAASCSSGSRSIRTSSVEPPPMSNRMAPRPFGSSSGEQPITASAASVSRSITSSRMPVSAATRSRKPSAFGGRAAGFGRDQPQALCLFGLDLVAADAERGDGALDRGVADTAGRRDALAQPDDPRERIDHAKSVAGRTGDQQAAIIGAEVERGVDAGSARRRGRIRPLPCGAVHRRYAAALGRRLRAAQGRREAACHRSSKMSFRGPHRPTRNFRSRKL